MPGSVAAEDELVDAKTHSSFIGWHLRGWEEPIVVSNDRAPLRKNKFVSGRRDKFSAFAVGQFVVRTDSSDAEYVSLRRAFGNENKFSGDQVAFERWRPDSLRWLRVKYLVHRQRSHAGLGNTPYQSGPVNLRPRGRPRRAPAAVECRSREHGRGGELARPRRQRELLALLCENHDVIDARPVARRRA